MKICDLKNKLIFTAVYLLAAALLYLSGIGCVFRYFLHIPCPGCGITRACLAAIRLDFGAALRYNPMFWSVPILYLYFLFDGKIFKSKILNILLFAIIAIGFIINWLFALSGLFLS